MLSTMLWIILAVYGLAMFAVSPTARRFGEFYAGRRSDDREVGQGLLIGSVVISWIFAKSITNAANLGEEFGLVGAVAYAGWYLSIPVAGFVIYLIRRRAGVGSLTEFLTTKYGRGAAAAFMLVVMIRLVNEVWSNTAVVGTYFGPAGTLPYFAAAMVFAFLTLAYTLRGGLRSSILTDGIQFILGLALLAVVLAWVLPSDGPRRLVHSGTWTLAGGADLLLVALLQSFSYPFHDPVLTDRAFITDAKKMLRGYLWSGVIAAAFIVLFGLVGVHARDAGLAAGQDTPFRVAQSFGLVALVVTTVLMMVSAGSTLDSTLSSFSKAVVLDVGGERESGPSAGLSRRLTRWLADADSLKAGRWMMVLAVAIGSVPLFTGAAILKATTVSGTMVLGLAPAFLLFAWPRPRATAFHLALWPGVVLGVLYAAGRVPAGWSLGNGPNASLLGVNVYGTFIVFAGFGAGAILDSMSRRARVRAISTLLAVGVLVLAACLGHPHA
jgi:SSS family solute:Na+ symporter